MHKRLSWYVLFVSASLWGMEKDDALPKSKSPLKEASQRLIDSALLHKKEVSKDRNDHVASQTYCPFPNQFGVVHEGEWERDNFNNLYRYGLYYGSSAGY